MSGKESKPFEKFKSELRMFFKGPKNIPGTNQMKFKDEYALTVEFERQLSNEVPITQRIKAMKELKEIVLHAKLEKNVIEKICRCLDDVIFEQQYKDYRHLVISFYQSLVQGQYDRLGVTRPYFFRVIKNNDNKEDMILRFELFQKLTNHGKNITTFEEEIGEFLLEWMDSAVAFGKTTDFLFILVNYIKYNSAYIDEDVINRIVQNTCSLCCESGIEPVVSGGLDVLDTIICYSKLSQRTIISFISALSRSICLEQHNTTSWKIMRNLLGTHMGHYCLQTLCFMLQEENYYEDTGLVSGIIFILNMALLNNKPDFLVGCIPTLIIPSILKASTSNDPVILVEVCLCVKWIVENYGKELKDPTWDKILIILESVILKIGQSNFYHPQVYICDIFNKVESLLKENQCNADMEHLFSFCQKWSFMMPEAFIFHLTNHYFNRIVLIEPNWTSKVHDFVSTFLISETRPSIRIFVLKAFVNIIQENSYHHESEIMNNIVKPYFGNFAFEKNEDIRSIALNFLIKFCYTYKGNYMESILEILEKVLKAPFEQKDAVPINESCSADLKVVVQGLLEVFVFSIYELPSSNAIKILNILVSFLKWHYEKSDILDVLVDVRWRIIECLLRLRADSKCRIGYTTDFPNNVKYSSYLLADYKKSSNSSFSSSSRGNSKSSEGSCSSFEEEFYEGYVLTYISLTNACRVIVTTLTYEKDWEVLQLILIAIPTALRNRALVFSKYNSEVGLIVYALMSMITDNAFLDSLKNTPPKFVKSDFYSHVIPVLSAFASYHTHLEFNQQQRLIKCLEIGLVNKSASQCVTALMICLLEMREAMVKLLPEILLNLSKISATKYVAIPILEFLSLLTTFPQVFGNFIPNQYMSIFAIIFPYTNPFKYHHYIVSLAHHVIAVWFLKCRRPLRRDFVEYIIKGVKNQLVSFDKENFQKPSVSNEDSSNRKRSSSLTEQGSRRKEKFMMGSGRVMVPHANGGIPNIRRDFDETSITFHEELTETCIDLMSRVAFTSCSALPKRNPGSEFLLRNGQSSTWLLGNSLITVTTTSCTQKPMYNGYCDKCYSSCVIDKGLPPLDPSAAGKHNESSDIASSDSSSNIQKQMSKPLTRHLSINSEDGLTYSENNTENDERRINDSLELSKTSINKDDRESYDFCTCWCQGWAEIYIRRPTGDISWIMRLQNETCSTPYKNPLTDISTLYQASVVHEGVKVNDNYEKLPLSKEASSVDSSLQCSRSSSETAVVEDINRSPPIDINTVSQSENSFVSSNLSAVNVNTEMKSDNLSSIDNSKSSESSYVDAEQGDETRMEGELDEHYCQGRNPVRRSNSSPEMSSSWKNSFVKDSSRSFNSSPVNALEQYETNEQCSLSECKKLGKHCYSKELRCNCEAIPEEFSGFGTTPPKTTLSNAITNIDAAAITSDVESSANSPSPSISFGSISQNEKSSSNPQLPPSSSYDNVDSNEKKTETKFFDEHGLPNDDFEFSRSASTSQVTSMFKKHPPLASYNLSHNLTTSQPHLTTKPPPSPPIHPLRSIKHSKDYSSTDSHSDSFNNLNQDYKRGRVHTISVMSPTKKPQSEWDSRSKISAQRNNEPKKSGVNPSFVFLQLYDSSQFSNTNEKPILIPSTPANQRALNVFDLIPPYETHKVGVIYVGPGQANNETQILSNVNGTTRYVDFLSKLGTLVKLAEVNSQNVFLGGLEQNGDDGKYAYIWKDDIMQVIFHVATLMPNKENDVNCNNKKKHIGNDYVTIVYNESGEEYNLNTVKCQFNFACIVVEPLDHGSNQVTVKARDDLLKLIGNVETKIVSDKNVSLLARQLALHINLASLVLCSMNKDKNYGGIYASNWLERLRKIKQIKKKVIDEVNSSVNQTENLNKQSNRRNDLCNFTDYT